MATEYKLSYTASEINEKLGKIDDLVSTVNGVTPDANGNVVVEVEDGYSPTAVVTQAIGGATISITDVNGTTTATIENGTATDEQVAAWLDTHPEATTTVQDGAVTIEKLAGFDSINNLVPWKLFYDGTNTNTDALYPDENSAIFVLHLEKGKMYYVSGTPYPSPTNMMPNANYEDNNYHGYYAVYSAELIAEDVKTANKYPNTNRLNCGMLNTCIQVLYNKGYIEDTTGYDWTQAYACGYFKMLEDVWVYRASLKPTVGMLNNNNTIFELASGAIGDAISMNFLQNSADVFKFDLSNGFATDKFSDPTALMEVRTKTTDDRIYAAMSRDVPRDRSLRIMFIGDSIVYAGSNAGLQHAYRKYVSMNLNAPCVDICQSGVSVTTGSGSFDWNGQTGDAYNSTLSGYAGLVTKLPQATASHHSKIQTDGTDIVVVGLGTNDFWNDAPLGSVSDLTDDTTFYGAVEKTLTILETTFPNAQILWVLPFKNERWATANSAGNTLMEYMIALKILCQTHERVWVLDLFDKWYLDYDNESIRRKFFIDGVHITGNAHKCVAETMIEKIREVVSIVGLKRIEQPKWYRSDDSRYGAQ